MHTNRIAGAPKSRQASNRCAPAPALPARDSSRDLAPLGRVEGMAVVVKWLLWGMRNS
jgi:hypothetical protein